MKRFVVIIALAITAFTLHAATPADVPSDSIGASEPVDSITALKNQVTSLQTSVSEMSRRIEQLNREKRALQNQLEDANAEIARFNERNLRLQDEKIALIKQDSLLRQENSNLFDNQVSMAANFIYVPYDKFSINEIALPVLSKIENSPKIDEYSIQINLIKNYKSDMNSLIGLLKETIPTLRKIELALKTKCDEASTKLQSLDVYKNYNEYADWEATYLGKTMKKILSILDNPSVEHTQNDLTAVQNQLESLIDQK